MTTETNTETTPESSLFSESNRATYCPEDNKLRLYVGRVPRDEYEALRADGWTSTPKQDCDFVATWTPRRRDTCIDYAGIIEDEDQGPDERAADRAERFGGYLEKRADEAGMHADKYESGPSAHGFQNERKAERAAARHDRIGTRATDAWSKAEYWQRRTAGVISHALYVCRPDVRMGRIKTLEAELRSHKARHDVSTDYRTDWITHLELRLAYENQMLEAQGGRAAFVEMEVGGWLGSYQIHKVNKSNATGRVVSVGIMVATNGRNKWGNAWPTGYVGPTHRLETITVERMKADVYRPPTDEERAAFLNEKKAAKASAPKIEKPPLINPTDEDAERLQAALNERAKADHCKRHLKAYGRDYADEFKPSTVYRITQATYSAASKGSYARAETRGLCRGAELEPRASNMYSSREQEEKKRRGPKVCEVRTTGSDGSDYGARRVIVLTDKPQKPLPAAVWEAQTELATA